MKKYKVIREITVTVVDYINAINDDDAMIKADEMNGEVSLASEISKAEHRLIDTHANVLYSRYKENVKVLK